MRQKTVGKPERMTYTDLISLETKRQGREVDQCPRLHCWISGT